MENNLWQIIPLDKDTNPWRRLGGVAENIIEDLEAGPQMRAVRLHLKDVVLKNVNFNYVGKEFRKNSLTKTRFKFFHSGSSVIVAGKYDPVSVVNLTRGSCWPPRLVPNASRVEYGTRKRQTMNKWVNTFNKWWKYCFVSKTI